MIDIVDECKDKVVAMPGSIVEQWTFVDIKDFVRAKDTWRKLRCGGIPWTEDILPNGRVFWLRRGNIHGGAFANQVEELGSRIEMHADAAVRARRIVDPSGMNAIG